MTATSVQPSALELGSPARDRRLPRLAWASVGYTLLVILFGAIVRITGSGAGCGQHWPTCQGEIATLPRSVETAIELSHRVTSGLALIFVVVVLVLARRWHRPGHPTRFWAALGVLFMVVEALIGAALVLLELVGNNDSLARAVVMSLHLVNTSLLLGALGLTAWTAGGGRLGPARGRAWVLLVLGMFGVLLVSTTGAVTALGDTLYPAASGGSGARLLADHAPDAHFLQRLRIVHPILAGAVALFLLFSLPRARAVCTGSRAPIWANVVRSLVLVQVAAGFLNVWLSAPGWLQVVHLALASALWLALVLLAAEEISAPRQAPN
jgi:heme a synthase